jgi:hypothetical protein
VYLSRLVSIFEIVEIEVAKRGTASYKTYSQGVRSPATPKLVPGVAIVIIRLHELCVLRARLS